MKKIKNMKIKVLVIILTLCTQTKMLGNSDGGGTSTDYGIFDFVSGIQPIEPTTASLGRYGEYQMDLSNGMPDISITLYEIKSGDLTVPIVLRYQGGGIKVQEDATWVGLGWDLFYGGQITRNMQGFPDECEPNPQDRPDASVIHQQIQQLDITNAYGNPEFYNWGLSAQCSHSFMPDEFYYNIGLESGKFIGLNEKVMVPYKPVSITKTGNNWNINFSIKNAKGEKYYFKPGETTKQHGIHTREFTSAWFVDSIIAPNNHYITYEYQTDGTYYPNNIGWYEGFRHDEFEGNGYGGENNPPQLQTGLMPMKEMPNQREVTSTKPQTIIFENGRIQFALSSRDDIETHPNYPNPTPLKKLECMAIQRLIDGGSYELIKFIWFEYFYYCNRLMLERVYEEYPDGTKQTIAEFEYDLTPLAGKKSFNYDFCGYNNGVNNSSPIPGTAIFSGFYRVFVGEANKKVDEAATKAGVLTAIKYPTKGKTVFEWENHRYGADEPIYLNQYINIVSLNSVPSDPDCIYNHDDFHDPTLDCITNGSIGINCIMDQSIRIVGEITQTNYWDPAHQENDDPRIKVTNTTTGKILLNINLPTGWASRSVDEIVNLTAGNYYTVYLTTMCTANTYIWANVTYFEIDNDNEKNNYKYGGLRIKEITNYDSDNTLLEKTLYTYVLPDNPKKSSGYITNTAPIMNYVLKTYIFSYMQSGGSPGTSCGRILSKEYLVFDLPSGGIYPNNLSYQYVQVQKINQDGTTNGTTKYEFNQAYDETNVPDQPGIPTITKAHERGFLLNEKVYSADSTLLKETINSYSFHPNITGESRGFKMLLKYFYRGGTFCYLEDSYNPRTMYSPHNYYYITNWMKKDTTIVREYYGQDYIENKIVYTYNDLNSCLPTKVVSYFNGNTKSVDYFYRNQKPLIIEEKLNDMPVIKNTAKYHQGPNSSVIIDTILVKYGSVPDIKEFSVSNYENEHYNILQYEGKDNVPVTCLWGYKNLHLIAEIKNATYTDVSAIINETVLNTIAAKPQPAVSDWNTINSLRANLPNAMVTTYKYKPLEGIESITDPQGITTYFEYDGLGRLINMKIGEKNYPADSDETKRVLENYYYNYKLY